MPFCFNCLKNGEGGESCPYCGTRYPSLSGVPNQLAPGTLLNDRYIIGECLGHGGFGITYKAWDNSLYRLVCVKEYLPSNLVSRTQGSTEISFFNDNTQELFSHGVQKTLDETRALARFNTESVVSVYDCFKANGTAYIIMELLEGEDVKMRLNRDGAFSLAETLSIIEPVLTALARVHASGLIHRDISPDNIFLCSDGRVKILDFGSARNQQTDGEKSLSVILKYGYAPKEQYIRRGEQGPWTDIYAVSATIYKMLTGITPVESIERLGEGDTLKPLCEVADVSQDVSNAVMKGLAINARDRWQNADEMLSALKKAAEADKTVALPPEKAVLLNHRTLSEVTVPLENEAKAVPAQEKVNVPAPSDETTPLQENVVPEALTEALPDPKETQAVGENVIPANTGASAASSADNGKKKKTGIIAAVAAVVVLIAGIAVWAGMGQNKSVENPGAVPAKTQINDSAEEVTFTTKTAETSITALLTEPGTTLVTEQTTALTTQTTAPTTATTQKPTTQKATTKKQSSNNFSNASIGSHIYFGLYEQDNNTSNGKEKIEWRVLDKKNGKLLVISEKALDCKPYNTELVDVTWETCTLRKWLNGTFYNNAFSSMEQTRIANTYVVNDDNPDDGTEAGNDTTDKVFLLSLDEVNKYFSSDEDRMCVPTKYAFYNGAHTSNNSKKNGEATCWWWLRSPYYDSIHACVVGCDGLSKDLDLVSGTYEGVRPALWIEI